MSAVLRLTPIGPRLACRVLYRHAGVDVDAMNAVKGRIGRLVRPTHGPEVLSDIGLFGSLVRMPRMRDPVLVASCDSVGTKVAVASRMNRLGTVGVDLVNHSVNDILTLGARPLFLLDYIGHSTLSSRRLLELVRGLARACRANHCALVGGETAMMPGVYRPGDFDLVGFIVGVVERSRIVDAARIRPGDLLVGLPSSGLHTNGYSLARRVLFEKAGLDHYAKIPGLRRSIGAELLIPHRSYLAEVGPLAERVHGIAHITGGGFYDNIERLLPSETAVVIRRDAWRVPRIFRLIQELGEVPDVEMYRTFNMGIGMVLFVGARQTPALTRRLPRSRVIGKAVRGTHGVAVV